MPSPPFLSTSHVAGNTILSTDIDDIAAGLNSTYIGSVTVTAPTANHELVYNGTNWFNILHRYRPQAYGAVMNGSTDDSTAINNMLTDMSTAGRGYAEFPNRDIKCRNIAIPTRAIVDFNGATLSLPAGAASTDDVIRSVNFLTCTGTTNTTSSTPAAPYGFSLMNGTIDTGTGVGRHAVAMYGMNFLLENMLLICGGGGSALWTEYGYGNEDFYAGNQFRKGDTSLVVKNLTIFDYGTPAVFAPSGNNMVLTINAATVSGGTTLTCTTTRPHLATTGQSVVLASIGGITGAAGTFSTTITGPSAFSVPGTFSGAYTSGGSMTYAVSAGWCHLGPHDSFADHVLIIAPMGRVVGRRGLLMGMGTTGGSGLGLMAGNSHIYGNFDGGLDCVAGSAMFDGRSQVEGGYVFNVLARLNGRSRLPSRMFAGHGGVTQLSIRDSNQNMISGGIMYQGGQGLAPPAGFTNSSTYYESYNSSDNIIEIVMNHDYNTNAAVTSGSIPIHSFIKLYMDAYAISTATLAVGWATSIDANHAGLNMIPTGLTTTTG